MIRSSHECKNHVVSSTERKPRSAWQIPRLAGGAHTAGSSELCSATVQGLLGVQQSFPSLARHSGEAACQGHIQVAAVELMGTSGRCFPLLSGFTDRGLFSTTSLSWDNVHVYTVHNEGLIFHSDSS